MLHGDSFAFSALWSKHVHQRSNSAEMLAVECCWYGVYDQTILKVPSISRFPTIVNCIFVVTPRLSTRLTVSVTSTCLDLCFNLRIMLNDLMKLHQNGLWESCNAIAAKTTKPSSFKAKKRVSSTTFFASTPMQNWPLKRHAAQLHLWIINQSKHCCCYISCGLLDSQIRSRFGNKICIAKAFCNTDQQSIRQSVPEKTLSKLSRTGMEAGVNIDYFVHKFWTIRWWFQPLSTHLKELVKIGDKK